MNMNESLSKHNRLINSMVIVLSKAGYEDIRADIPVCNKKPKRIVWEGTKKGYVHDITAVKNGELHLFDVETEDTISFMQSSNREKFFASYAAHNNAVYSIVVPTGNEGKTIQQLNKLGVSAGVIEIMPY